MPLATGSLIAIIIAPVAGAAASGWIIHRFRAARRRQNDEEAQLGIELENMPAQPAPVTPPGQTTPLERLPTPRPITDYTRGLSSHPPSRDDLRTAARALDPTTPAQEASPPPPPPPPPGLLPSAMARPADYELRVAQAASFTTRLGRLAPPSPSRRGGQVFSDDIDIDVENNPLEPREARGPQVQILTSRLAGVIMAMDDEEEEEDGEAVRHRNEAYETLTGSSGAGLALSLASAPLAPAPPAPAAENQSRWSESSVGSGSVSAAPGSGSGSGSGSGPGPSTPLPALQSRWSFSTLSLARSSGPVGSSPVSVVVARGGGVPSVVFGVAVAVPGNNPSSSAEVEGAEEEGEEEGGEGEGAVRVGRARLVEIPPRQ
ncbi:hypothetical protein GGS20DRAFT_598600 [Poronia punctata]|nr:hypothetical protein GGS20DRAFT_598600 [Poronia punctata]